MVQLQQWKQKRLTTVTLCSTSGNEWLEVWYYGDLLTIRAIILILTQQIRPNSFISR